MCIVKVQGGRSRLQLLQEQAFEEIRGAEQTLAHLKYEAEDMEAFSQVKVHCDGRH